MNQLDISMAKFNLQNKKIDNLDRFSNLNNSKNSKSLKEEALRNAASEFEAVFVKQLMDVMDSTVQKSGFLSGGEAENIFKSMLNEEMAKNISSNSSTSFGIAEQLYNQMKELL